MSATYTPNPIDTSKVELPAELTDLGEELAAHVHDLWALERIKQGWQRGEKRDDDKKEHPCLVPYNGLSENEKAFDRGTAQGTLKAILAKGYKIVKA